jgi:hypothetical protein
VVTSQAAPCNPQNVRQTRHAVGVALDRRIGALADLRSSEAVDQDDWVNDWVNLTSSAGGVVVKPIWPTSTNSPRIRLVA